MSRFTGYSHDLEKDFENPHICWLCRDKPSQFKIISAGKYYDLCGQCTRWYQGLDAKIKNSSYNGKSRAISNNSVKMG